MAVNGEDRPVDQVELHDGYAVEQNNERVAYKLVKLREASYGDDVAARKASERAVKTADGWRLLESQALYDVEMIKRQVVELQRPGLPPIPGHAIDIGKLSELDMQRIHGQLQLIELAAHLRHGLIDQATYERAISGRVDPDEEAEAPRGRPEPAADTAGDNGVGEGDGLRPH